MCCSYQVQSLFMVMQPVLFMQMQPVSTVMQPVMVRQPVSMIWSYQAQSLFIEKLVIQSMFKVIHPTMAIQPLSFVMQPGFMVMQPVSRVYGI